MVLFVTFDPTGPSNRTANLVLSSAIQNNRSLFQAPGLPVKHLSLEFCVDFAIGYFQPGGKE